MKILLFIIVGVVVSMTLLFVYYSLTQKAPQIVLDDGQLPRCPATPNCVCSEYASGDSSIAPISIDEKVNWSEIIQSVEALGGVVVEQNDDYVHVTFTSTLFRFVDDVVLRIDRSNNLLHVRSAYRVGHSDMGVNRKRVESLRNQINAKA